MEKEKKTYLIGFAIVSFLLSFSLIVGAHIHIGDTLWLEDMLYYGTKDENYLTEFTQKDVLIGLIVFAGIFYLLILVDRFLKARPKLTVALGKEAGLTGKKVLIVSGILFLLWLPYLFIYWPGIILGDSQNIIRQAGFFSRTWYAAHPPVHTLFVAVCLKLGRMLGGGNTLGVAIYSLIQMIYMAGCLGYFIVWLMSRARLKCFWYIIFIAGYGYGYIAAYSVALWKDGMFSTAIVMLTVLLADAFVFQKKEKPGKLWWFSYGFFTTVMVLIRNNGIYVLLFTLISMLLFVRQIHKTAAKKTYRMVVIVSILLLLFEASLRNIVYPAFYIIPSVKAESVGVFLNQMGRVGAYNGKMKEEDRAYLNELLPLEKYPEAYRPCFVDLLKWDSDFNGEMLYQDFEKHWFSLLIQNPRLYVEAWVMQTFGYWTVNRTEQWRVGTIWQGYSYNTGDERLRAELKEYYDVELKNLTENEELRMIFFENWPSIPIGYSWFLMCIVAALLLAQKRGLALLAIAPSFSLILVLCLASPACYWARYGLAAQLLIPAYVLLLLYNAPDNVYEQTKKQTADVCLT